MIDNRDRELVGMTEGAKKRAARLWRGGRTRPDFVPQGKAMWRIGQRLRPCRGCEECRGYDVVMGLSHCAGRGVLPARRARPQGDLSRRAACTST
jgi:hypothetical protein